MTPVQFGVLTVLCQQGISDIVSIGRRLGVDRITVANVLRRLERRNLVKRPLNSVDKRRKLAQVTKQGRTLVDAVQPAMIRAQRRFVHPLDSDEQAMLDKLLSKLLLTNNEASRAPLK
ncbi:MAG TPA: MarR family transcriptional regulator [Gammaproteobacteria bacterium]|nr:MarR family transcriptional regulator [Gammaproteobacteria bacterium]